VLETISLSDIVLFDDCLILEHFKDIENIEDIKDFITFRLIFPFPKTKLRNRPDSIGKSSELDWLLR
jgi:hypothetical protein